MTVLTYAMTMLDWRHMSSPTEAITVPLSPVELADRWRALSADPTFEDVAAKLELTEWGEMLMTPVSKSHGLAAMRIAEALRKTLGGHAMAEVGVSTPIGVRAPDVAWCSDAYLANHPEELPLSSAPELCVEIVSASNALPKLREKAAAYVHAGATEAWLVFPESRQVEVYSAAGHVASTTFAIELTQLFN